MSIARCLTALSLSINRYGEFIVFDVRPRRQWGAYVDLVAKRTIRIGFAYLKAQQAVIDRTMIYKDVAP